MEEFNIEELLERISELQEENDFLRKQFNSFDEPVHRGNPMLDKVLETTNPEFTEWVHSLPPIYWVRYDLSAARIGWEAAMNKRNE